MDDTILLLLVKLQYYYQFLLWTFTNRLVLLNNKTFLGVTSGCWRAMVRNYFSVKSLCDLMSKNIGEVCLNPFKLMKLMPLKVNYFVWRLFRNKILTSESNQVWCSDFLLCMSLMSCLWWMHELCLILMLFFCFGHMEMDGRLVFLFIGATLFLWWVTSFTQQQY